MLYDLTNMWNYKNNNNKRNSQIQGIEWWLPGSKGSSGQNGWTGQKIQTPSHKISHGNVIFSIINNLVSNIELYIWKLLREEILKISITRKKSVTVSWWMLIRFIVYTNIKSLCCNLKLAMLCVNYNHLNICRLLKSLCYPPPFYKKRNCHSLYLCLLTSVFGS